MEGNGDSCGVRTVAGTGKGRVFLPSAIRKSSFHGEEDSRQEPSRGRRSRIRSVFTIQENAPSILW